MDADENGYLSAISITIPVPANSSPRITETPDQSAKANIEVPFEPKTHQLREELRTVQGLLAFYGLREIELNHMKQEWLPDTDEERANLLISSFSFGRVDRKDTKQDPVPYDLIVRSLAAADMVGEHQTVLGFFRKGCIDTDEARYIDAFYDFFFVFEHLYGGGQYRTRQMKANFRNSSELVRAAREVQSDFYRTIPYNNPKEKALCQDRYMNRSPEEILENFVDLRGFLHHHSATRSDNWDPEGHDAYKIHSLFAQRVAFSVCWKCVSGALFGKEGDKALFSTSDHKERKA